MVSAVIYTTILGDTIKCNANLMVVICSTIFVTYFVAAIALTPKLLGFLIAAAKFTKKGF